MLGTLAGDYHIQIRQDAKPHAPRHVPLPLRSKVAEELDRMDGEGTRKWCAGMVVKDITNDGIIIIGMDQEEKLSPKAHETLSRYRIATLEKS